MTDNYNEEYTAIVKIFRIKIVLHKRCGFLFVEQKVMHLQLVIPIFLLMDLKAAYRTKGFDHV
jgi:hypothetical protein